MDGDKFNGYEEEAVAFGQVWFTTATLFYMYQKKLHSLRENDGQTA